MTLLLCTAYFVAVCKSRRQLVCYECTIIEQNPSAIQWGRVTCRVGLWLSKSYSIESLSRFRCGTLVYGRRRPQHVVFRRNQNECMSNSRRGPSLRGLHILRCNVGPLLVQRGRIFGSCDNCSESMYHDGLHRPGVVNVTRITA